MADLYENKEVREFAEQMVRREVYACASTLVSELAQSSEAQSALKIEDDIISLCVRDDWQEPADDWIRNADADELRDACEYMRAEVSEDATEDQMRTALRAEIADDDEQARDLCDYVREDAHQIEAYEHWIVSDWLARKLGERGEMVGELLGLTIWGRPTTGQGIAMDSVILEIARDALKA